ncbi:Rad52/Rad22 family DNA repair protein [Burkholderia cenocepacia]|uniref:Rad52/Rad22 family DNA repair protein n=1 Tax=Burkholderia cenocepacia TaxID=95486 RepID=UPI0007621AA1|nr:Rad52/Rad22 family DNA repair protein [Burkholderia cenocepacia]KWU17771.1 hypothetical protein AS149_13710 [Burkholderia cenocepacia]
MDTKQKLEQLTAVFPASTIKWKVQDKKVEGNVTFGLAVPYLDARDYQNRLDTVLTPAGWANEMKPSSVGVVSAISILLDGHWVSKSDGAQFDGYSDGKGPRAKELAIKGAFSDAFKRAGVMWGIGRYLYEFKAEWVELNEKDEPKSTPKLPSHMVPEADRDALAGAANVRQVQEAEARVAAEQAEREAAERQAAAEQAQREEAARQAAAEQAQREAAARQAAAEQEQRDAAARQAAAEQAQREEAARQAAEQAQREEAARQAAAEQAKRDEAARAAAEKAAQQAAAQAAAKPAANDPVVDADEAASIARSSAIVDGAMSSAGDARSTDAPTAAGKKVFKGYDYSHLTLTEAEESDVLELLKKFESVKSFMVLARYITSEKLATRLNKEARDWILEGLEKLHNKKWADAA